ncbi:Signal transduction histidine kinase [Saccharopolyspora kobensis]|uniref:histidine kinase n=1 Tax=Saccharopolyspora kobensis TaxID=146035 RepID=A0A1H6EAS8_9PSEU|nr:HAMP domain-containing sensor histidine kinase [Saccharopolyspora kobensis]SEG94988.1 Signal transduction histidine kinase [Saccharopolyspora kobensis]SFD61369.1 Signal transduction histidine kinase [Saccharopolyspora kobensis]
MNLALIALIAVCESLGVGLIGLVVLRLLRDYPVGYSLVAVIIITVGAINTSTVTAVLLERSAELPAGVVLAVVLIAGVVAVGIGLLLGRSVMNGSRQLADATRSLGLQQRFRQPEDLPSAEFAELARELWITSDKLAESRRREAESRRREQALDASRRRLVAWISHDLRSPLARLRALTESIEDGVVDDLRDYCGKIRADTEILSGMVDDLFELSRIQSGVLNLSPRQVALDDLLSDEVAALGVVAGERGIGLRARTIEPVVVDVDDRAITRVFNNLLGNAIRYAPEGSAVTVDVRATAGWAAVSVSDECGGIPEADLDSVFDMGWRGEDERTFGSSGGGLGLAIVQGLVHAHSGTVSVRNVPGGCCFEVRLPLSAR